MASQDSFGAKGTLEVGDRRYEIYRLSAVARRRRSTSRACPTRLKVLLENLLRTEDGADITADDIRALAGWDAEAEPDKEIQFTPARVIMQDFTGVPVRRRPGHDARGDGRPRRRRRRRSTRSRPAELVIDHSVIADVFGTPQAFERNVEIEYERNRERYQFLRWGQGAFDDFKVVPPGTGIVHQVNIEHLARVVFTRDVRRRGATVAYPDTCVGTDSHTTMVNGIGVVGWGVGGIEAEAAMLGQPVCMLIPRVVGFKLSGELPEGATATDLVLTITEMLRKHGVVGKFVEFYGDGVAAAAAGQPRHDRQHEPGVRLDHRDLPDRRGDPDYLRLTGRTDEQLALVEAYAKEQGLWHDPERRAALLASGSSSTCRPSYRRSPGPKRPQDRVARRAKGSGCDVAVARRGARRDATPRQHPSGRPRRAPRRRRSTAQDGRDRPRRRRRSPRSPRAPTPPTRR